MKPTVDLFGFATIPTYPVMMVLGYVAGLWVIMRLASKDEIVERAQAWDLFIVMVVASVMGAKMGHTLFEAPGHELSDGSKATSLIQLLKDDPLHWARIGEGGYVWYGGMVGALSTAVFYFWRRPHLNAWRYSDLFAPAIMAGAVVGRLGCFLAGCCYGKVTDVAWGVNFPRVAGAVHPTQLYDASVALVLAVVLFWRYPKRGFDGANIALLLMLYPVLRATTEIFRGDADRGLFGPLSTSQWISIPLLIIGLVMYLKRGSKPEAAIA